MCLCTELGEEEVVWFMSDADDERGEKNKQGEEEAADDEVKKWSEWSEWNAEALAMHELNRTATAHRIGILPSARVCSSPQK